jgi:nitrite reductase (NO-forming)
MRQQLEAGESIYAQACLACHQYQGQGLPGMIPPLADSDYLREDRERNIAVLLQGLSGPLTVKGKYYNSFMPQFSMLSDQEIANVLTFVRHSWGNNLDAINPAEVTTLREKLPPTPAQTFSTEAEPSTPSAFE